MSDRNDHREDGHHEASDGVPGKPVRAYHEAGHTVVDRRVGHIIKSVSIKIVIDPRSGERWVDGVELNEETRPQILLRRCAYDGNVDEGDEKELLAALVGIWAGPAAQAKYRPESVQPVDSESDLCQLRRCIDVLCRWTPRRKGGLTTGIKRRAKALMNDPSIWREVEAVAKALVEHEEMSGAQVEAVIRAANPTGGEPGGVDAG